jgi:hypothetical protein
MGEAKSPYHKKNQHATNIATKFWLENLNENLPL